MVDRLGDRTWKRQGLRALEIANGEDQNLSCISQAVFMLYFLSVLTFCLLKNAKYHGIPEELRKGFMYEFWSELYGEADLEASMVAVHLAHEYSIAPVWNFSEQG